ncbi:MAG TPA: BA14K family protein [Saliniramus sp.]|nr:BA14K family protein [Saliniramus sp.]
MSKLLHDLLRKSRPKLLSGLLAAGAIGALAIGGTDTARANPLAGALAGPLSTGAVASFDENPLVQVQYRDRHGRRGYRGDRVIDRHYGDRPIYGDDYYGDYYGYDPGAAVVAGIFGLAAGAIIAGALAPPVYHAAPYGIAPHRVAPHRVAPRYATSDIAYCSRKYRSFDPVSFTYLGYDGRRHSCRIP